ncbi:hypothetical protein TNIN_253921 [Trichonephila inaurata madagascariensis]|uniref:Uncharacterized protein n=1 Tax=Trichonephila inaurata madagascariensis TaxID=2747483 RepID=A0A8X6Y4B2_9ARAC|nr:hypothetical protein TNIN_253921 [Trichonephila inaurata madagascariensis]
MSSSKVTMQLKPSVVFVSFKELLLYRSKDMSPSITLNLEKKHRQYRYPSNTPDEVINQIMSDGHRQIVEELSKCSFLFAEN